MPRAVRFGAVSMEKLGLAIVALAALAISGCGGGGSSTPALNPTVTPATPTLTPAPVPSPCAVVAAYTTTFGVSGAAPSTLGFLAPTLTASLTATETNYTGAFTAASSCAAVTVSPASSTTGGFTLTAAGAAATGCTITITGAHNYAPATGAGYAALAAPYTILPFPGGKHSLLRRKRASVSSPTPAPAARRVPGRSMQTAVSSWYRRPPQVPLR